MEISTVEKKTKIILSELKKKVGGLFLEKNHAFYHRLNPLYTFHRWASNRNEILSYSKI